MKKSGFLLGLAVSGTAAISQSPTEDQATKRGPNNDPNQIVCINEAEIGSRLTRRRVCRTRAEWVEHQRQLRQNVETAQQQKQSNY